jgi:hypothetical protein
MVVVTARVARDGTARLPAAIIESDDYRADRAGEWGCRVASLPGAAWQIVHFAGVTVLDPCVERSRGLHRAECGNSDQVEAESICLCLEEIFEADGFSDCASHSVSPAQWA